MPVDPTAAPLTPAAGPLTPAAGQLAPAAGPLTPAAGRLTPAAGRPREERGSALVLTLMVMVILSVLGISFLMLADTENQIAIADRDGRQVLYVAMSGAKIVESWFNVPDPAYNAFVPARAECVLDERVGDSDYDGIDDIDVPTNGLGQRYRGGTATGTYRLFDKPFRGHPRDTFWGTRDNPDLMLVNDPASDDDYLDELGRLFNQADSRSLQGLEITEIRVFAPPYDTTLQQRFGICTVSVTAAKFLERGSTRRRLSERTVTIVLQEMPFPLPGACIEAQGNVDVSGNFGVHWGGTYTEGDLALQSGSNFPGPGIPRENTSRFRYADFSPAAPDLDLGTAGTQNLLVQLLTGDGGDPVEIRDPWGAFRAGQDILEATNEQDQPWPYDYTNGVTDDRSIFFQNQNYAFPELDYDFWKSFTQTRARNAWYFKYAGDPGGGAPLYRKNGIGAALALQHFLNTENPGVNPGIYFFDTANSRNPQDGGPGVLVPELKINSGTIDSATGAMIMEGLIYTNATLVDSSGISGHTVRRRVNMPGEPFLDSGIDIDRDGVVGSDFEEIETIGNNIWDFAFFGSTESDGQAYDELYNTPDFDAFEVSHRYVDGEVPHAHDDPRLLADTVHEPFLNLAYPDVDAPLDPILVDFDAEITAERLMGGDRDEDGVEDVLTSLRDRRGALVDLDIIVNGIWYNEGRYEGSGNLPVYGSILMKQGFAATGSPDIFFNEGIVLGDFPPPEMQIPRVYISQVDTDG